MRLKLEQDILPGGRGQGRWEMLARPFAKEDVATTWTQIVTGRCKLKVIINGIRTGDTLVSIADAGTIALGVGILSDKRL